MTKVFVNRTETMTIKAIAEKYCGGAYQWNDDLPTTCSHCGNNLYLPDRVIVTRNTAGKITRLTHERCP